MKALTSSPYLTTTTGLFDLLCTASFAYMMASASAAIWTSWSLAARISIFSFLIPHATKVILWSATALFWLRPRFGWRYPFGLVMLYCSAELLTNWIYVMVHYRDLADVWIYNIPFEIFFLAECFFVLGIVLSYTFLRGHFSLSLDWSMLPFVVFVGSWVAMGYQTESTIAFPSYWLEAQEFMWSVFYLIMAMNVFRPKSEIMPFWERPSVG